MNFIFPILLLFISNSVFSQVELFPLYQYSVGQEKGHEKNVQLRTSSVLELDTLKLPFIEDFSGAGVPLEQITTELFEGGPILVYQLKYIKLHQLATGDSVRVFNTATKNDAASLLINGQRFVKVIDKYTIQLFNDIGCTIPTTVSTDDIMKSTNWMRNGGKYFSSKPLSSGFVNDSGGVFINTDMSLDPINIGVASFDGANYNGLPYSPSTIKTFTDKLTSLPFDFSKNKINDSIYFSFYWQSKSLGDTPQPSEKLVLEFKDKLNVWKEVWVQYGGSIPKDTFKLAMLAIKDTAYFHPGFQYRFRSFGVPYGRFNVWNVDYIYINTLRQWNESPLKDIMILQTNQGCLKNYSSVPYKHLQNLSASELASEADSAFIVLRDKKYDPINNKVNLNYYHQVINNLGLFSPIQLKNDQPPGYQYSYKFLNTIDASLLNQPYVYTEEFSYSAADTTDRFDLSFNNFTKVATVFHNYYAYDDNIPEIAILTRNTGGIKIGNAFKILKSDTLTSIDYCFLRNNGPDMTGTEIFMNVWKLRSDLKVGSTTLDQKIKIQYSPDINGFVRYDLTSPIRLDSGETYIFGFNQKVANDLFIGYDKNNDRLDKIYLSLNSVDWIRYQDVNQVKGALMIRPVFDNHETITSIKNQNPEANSFIIFPNPTQSELHFTGNPEYISIYDLSGLLLIEKKVNDLESISTEALPNGLYVVILTKGDYKEAKRLIIQK